MGSARGVQQCGRGPGPSWWGYRGVPQGFEDRKGCHGAPCSGNSSSGLHAEEGACSRVSVPLGCACAPGVRVCAPGVRVCTWGARVRLGPRTLPAVRSALTWFPGLPVSWPQEDGSSAHVSCSPLSGGSHWDLPPLQFCPLDISPWPPPSMSQAGFSIFILKQPLLRVLCSRDLSELTRALGLWDWNDDADDVSTKP